MTSCPVCGADKTKCFPTSCRPNWMVCLKCGEFRPKSHFDKDLKKKII